MYQKAKEISTVIKKMIDTYSMTKRQIIMLVFLFLFSTVTLSAGDVASFVNLGFSEDSKHFLFGQYGIMEESTRPYADLFTVEVSKNSFSPGGVFHGLYSGPVEPGYEGIGALFTLYSEHVEKIRSFDIDHIKTGRILYILVNGETPKPELSFRDFYTGHTYNVTLHQNVYEENSKVSASFYINLRVTTKNGKSEYFTVGLPDFKREKVKKYLIRKIIISPDQRSLVFVIEKEMLDKGGVNIRYMVETVEIR